MTRRTALLGMAAVIIGFGAIVAPAQQQVRSDRAGMPTIVQRLPYASRDWRLTLEVVLEGDYNHNYSRRQTTQDVIDLEKAVVVLPVAPATASSAPRTSDVVADLRGDRGQIDATPRTLDDAGRLLEGYPGGDRLVALDVDALTTHHLRARVQVPMRCWETRIDERRAFAQRWPTEDIEDLYPEEALSALQPERFIESDAPEIRELVFNWTGGDPHILQPYTLAKTLAAKVIEHYMPLDDRYTTLTLDGGYNFYVVLPVAGTYYGLRVEGAVAAATADQHRGPVFDLPNLLCAVYRAAGIPARVVIGYDTRSERQPNAYPAITAWVEFFLWDNANARGEWVPVDIVPQRAFASKAPPIQQPWKFFGQNEDSEWICPLSLHWHPPTFVMSEGPPLLWGWLPTPGDQHVTQRMRVLTTGLSKRGDDPPFDGTTERP
ncbi:MAG: hypothetical protein KDA20_10525 [Phycisphaerales bacterium]|nr:hypothetical protein [Phycisphaerales bacterium]